MSLSSPLSLLSPSRTILMIADDALFVYASGKNGLKMVEAVPWDADDFERNVSDIIAKDCGGRPILIINDMVEQHYRKEKVPRVGMLDKQNVISRKLKVAFPNYPVRAALALKEKDVKTQSGVAGDMYIFAAVPASDSFVKTMDTATQSLAPLSGFCLLPVESSDMIKKLSSKVAESNELKARWTVFIGQHQSGGLRQVVVKDGELALTRMTPVSNYSGDDKAAWVNDVAQEFKATMSYLGRLGFDVSDGLRVIFMADEQSGDLLEEQIQQNCIFHALTVDQAAKKLGLDIDTTDDVSIFADYLHAAWIGKKSKFILPMKAKQIDTVSKPRQIAMLASAVLLLGVAFLGYQLFTYIPQVAELSGSIDTFKTRKARLDQEYDVEVQRQEALGFDVRLVQSALDVHSSLVEKEIPVFDVFSKVGTALGRDMRIDRMEVIRGLKMSIGSALSRDNDERAKHLYSASMQMSFPSTTNAQKGNDEVQALQRRMQAQMPEGTVVRVTKLLEDYEYSEEIVVESGDLDKQQVSQDFVAEITIEGPEIE